MRILFFDNRQLELYSSMYFISDWSKSSLDKDLLSGFVLNFLQFCTCIVARLVKARDFQAGAVKSSSTLSVVSVVIIYVYEL